MTNYKSGKFSGSAKGMHEPVEVALNIEDGKITDAKIDLGSASKSYASVADKLADEIVEKQTSDIDAVSGASVTSRAVQDAAYAALQQAGAEDDLSLKDGTFTATANGHGGPVEVTVTTKDNKIAKVEITKQTETPFVGDTAMKVIPQEIVDQQTLNVDAITGATMTSEAIINATHKAIDQAGNARAWAQKPYKSSIPTAEDREADVVIAGGGVSGLTTAAFAVKRGLKVIVLEKNGQIGGTSRYAAGMLTTYGSKYAKDAGQANDWDYLMNWIKTANSENPQRQINMDFLKHLLKETGKTFDELVEITNSKPNFVKMPYTMSMYGATGGHEAQLLEKYIKENGGQILTNTVIKKINVEGNHATSVVAENANGTFTIKTKNVVIATGGASYGKKNLLDKVIPGVDNIHLFNEANVGNTGDGYDVLKDVDAKFYDNDVYKSAMLDFNYRLHVTPTSEPAYGQAMIINDKGERFTNEAPFNIVNLTTQLYREGSPRYYVVYDSKIIQPEFKEKVDQLPEGLTTAVHAKTIKELAEKLNVNADNLQKTFDEYQKACETGEDKFGKDKANLVKFDDHDYYAVYTMPGSWGTIGGVKINQNMQVEKADGSHFDNLFAVGEMSTGELFSAYYMIGFSLGNYSTEGRLVAEQL